MDLYFIIDRRMRSGCGPHRWMVHLISNNAGPNGHTVRAINAITDERLARSTGAGYDLHGTVLADSVQALVGHDWGVPPIDGAVGVPAVIAHYAERDIDIIRDTDAMWAL